MILMRRTDNRRPLLWLAGASVLLASALLLIFLNNPSVVEAAKDAAEETGQTGVGGFKLSKWFDFAEYKRIYGKRYASAVQELARMKLYLGGVLRVIIAAIKHRFFGKRYYLSVNRFTDATDEEWRKEVLVDAAIMKGEASALSTGKEVDKEKRFEAAELSDIDTKLPEIFKGREATLRKFIDEMGSSAGGDESSDGGSSDADDSDHKLSADMLFRSPVHSVDSAGYLVPKSNNPHYEEPQVMSQAPSGELVENPLNEKDAEDINQSSGILDNILDGLSFLFNAAEQVATAGGSQEKKISIFSEGPDEVFVDHRATSCLSQPKHQLECGSCYAFSSMALYEYMYCMQHEQKQRKPVQFSPQYVIDCGPKRNPYLKGCIGGNPIKVAEFVNEFGLELELNYPYAAEAQMCPYDEEEDSAKMGYLRVAEPGLQSLKPEKFDDTLKRQPILISMFPNSELKAYGGGVYDNYACDYDYGHAMLLVGSGRKDNKEYWIIRNSLGAEWGEQGYLYMDKGAALNCLIEDGYISHAKFPSAKMNPQYTKQDIAKILNIKPPKATQSETTTTSPSAN